MRILIFSLIAMLSVLQVSAQLSVAPLFSDHAVLQREKPFPVWGWAKPGEQVTVQINNISRQNKADATGKWMVSFPAMDAGGPYVLAVKTSGKTLEMRDIWLGEVWICSGQSNMEWPVENSDNAVAEMKTAKDSLIRHLKIEREVSLKPADHLPQNTGTWQTCSPQTVGYFCGIGYFFARELFQKINDAAAAVFVHQSLQTVFL